METNSLSQLSHVVGMTLGVGILLGASLLLLHFFTRQMIGKKVRWFRYFMLELTNFNSAYTPTPYKTRTVPDNVSFNKTLACLGT